MRKVLAINASPNVDGLTAACATEFLAGAEAAGAEVELVHLCQLDVEHCKQCDNGWGACRTEGNCVLVDDFAGLRDKIAAADVWALANPVYFGDLSESAKAFTDRLRRCNIGDAGKALAQKDFVGIAAAGGSGGGTATCLMTMDRFCQHTGQRAADLITITRRSREYKLACIRECGRSVGREDGSDEG